MGRVLLITAPPVLVRHISKLKRFFSSMPRDHFDDLPRAGNATHALHLASEQAQALRLWRRDPTMLCTREGILQRVTNEGPWEFNGETRIEQGSFSGCNLKYVLRVNKDYPNVCPRVKIITSPNLRRHPDRGNEDK